MTTPKRPTPGELLEIRKNWMMADPDKWVFELFAEIDFLREENYRIYLQYRNDRLDKENAQRDKHIYREALEHIGSEHFISCCKTNCSTCDDNLGMHYSEIAVKALNHGCDAQAVQRCRHGVHGIDCFECYLNGME